MIKPLGRQLIGFVFSGGTAFLVDAGAYVVASPWLGAFWAKQLSFVLATLVSFFLNRTLTFGLKRTSWFRLMLFVLYYLLMAWVNPTLNWLLIPVFNNTVAAFIAATLVTAVVNFLFQRWVVFRQTA